eukprot:6593214-Heterocapsa_arctica.AAC.1
MTSLCKVDVSAVKHTLEHYISEKFNEHTHSVEKRLDMLTDKVNFIVQAIKELGITYDKTQEEGPSTDKKTQEEGLNNGEGQSAEETASCTSKTRHSI